MNFKVLFCLAEACIGMGCATICNRHTTARFSLDSSVPQAEVTIWRGSRQVTKVQTPASVSLDSSDGFFCRACYRFEFAKAGYLSTTEERSASFSAWYVGNIIFGGLIGLLIVDPLSGAMYAIDDELIRVNLMPKEGVAPGMIECGENASGAAYRMVMFNYDEKTRKGRIEMEVAGNAFGEARAWARTYIASVAKDKNIALSTDLKSNEGRFAIGGETLVGGDKMVIEFETLE